MILEFSAAVGTAGLPSSLKLSQLSLPYHPPPQLLAPSPPSLLASLPGPSLYGSGRSTQVPPLHLPVSISTTLSVLPSLPLNDAQEPLGHRIPAPPGLQAARAAASFPSPLEIHQGHQLHQPRQALFPAPALELSLCGPATCPRVYFPSATSRAGCA